MEVSHEVEEAEFSKVRKQGKTKVSIEVDHSRYGSPAEDRPIEILAKHIRNSPTFYAFAINFFFLSTSNHDNFHRQPKLP